MSAEANVTPLEERLSPPPTGGSDTTGLVLDSESDVYADVQSQLSLTKDMTTVHLLEEAPPLSAPSESPPQFPDVPQWKQEIEEWLRLSATTKLVLESVSRETFRALRSFLLEYDDGRFHRPIKAFYVSQLQHVELRQNSPLHYGTSMWIADMLFDEMRVISEKVVDRKQSREWKKLLSSSGCQAFFMPEGEVADEESKSNYTLMQPDGCVAHKLDSDFGDIYNQILPTVVVLVGIDLQDEEMTKDAHRWLRKRIGLTTEVNALINVSVRTESNACISIQLSVYGRPTQFKTDEPLTHLSPFYNLYSQVEWKQELNIKPIVPSISLPSNVLWRAGHSPKGYPEDARITLPAAELEYLSIDLLKSHRQVLEIREEWHDLL